jgi:hypothetical protein
VKEFGVAAGMSGSPIYLDGKLAGALAYGWSFANEALAGITPIEAMIRDTARPPEHETPAGTPRGSGGEGRARLRRLTTPLAVSGLSPRVLDRLASRLASRGVRPIRGGGGGGRRPGFDDLRLEPGAACSVELMRGDIAAAMLGTVTAVDGTRVLAFGHSSFDSGERIWPLATAWINYTVGSPYSSFKMWESGRLVGALVQDRQAGVAGEIGRSAPMIPAVVRVKNGVTGRADVFRVEVVQDPFYTGIMLSTLIDQAVSTAEGSMGPTRVRSELRLVLRGREKPVVSRDVFASEWGPTAYGAGAMIGRLLRNPFEKVVLERVELDAEVVHDRGDAWIETVMPGRQTVAPGDEVTVRVTLRSRRGERRTVAVPVRIPAGAIPGRPIELRIMGGDDVRPDVPTPDDVEGVIRLIEAFSPSTDLVVEVPVPRIDVTRRGRTVRGVPASVLEGLLPSAGDGAVRLDQAVLRSKVSTDRAVRGSAVLRLNVVKPGR